MKYRVKGFLFVIIVMVLNCNLTLGAEEDYFDLDTAYYTILETYKEAATGDRIRVNHIFYTDVKDKSTFFSMIDIDDNGTPELLISNSSGDLLNVLTYCDGKIICLLPDSDSMGYRVFGSLCENGILQVTAYGGATYTTEYFYRIRKDGCSCELFENYLMDSYAGTTELIDGSVISYQEGDCDKYHELYEKKSVNWMELTEQNIQMTIEHAKENMGESIIGKIVQAPVFCNGYCKNCRELLKNYYTHYLGETVGESFNINYYNDSDAVLQFAEITDMNSWPRYYFMVNTQTGWVKEVHAEKGSISEFNVIDPVVTRTGGNLGYTEPELSLTELYQKYADLIAQYEEKYGATTFTYVFDQMARIDGVAYLELVDFDKDGMDELLIAYNKDSIGDQTGDYPAGDYIFEIWGASGNEIVKKDAGTLYKTDAAYQTLRICELNGYKCVQNGMGSDFNFEYYHGFDVNGISIISTMCKVMLDQYGNIAYYLDGVEIDADTWNAERNGRMESCVAYTLNGSNPEEIIANIIETKKILSNGEEDILSEDSSDDEFSEQRFALTHEQADQGLSNYLYIEYPTSYYFPLEEQQSDKYVVWATYQTGTKEKLTVDLSTGDVYSEGPYGGVDMPYDDIPLEINYVINIFDYLE